MTVPLSATSPPGRKTPHRGTFALRGILAALAGLAAALLVSCGSSGKALIPLAHAGPLLSDFEAVRNAAENASGNCSATEAALRKTEEDFDALPSTVDAGLRDNIRQGIDNLRVRAHEMCIQPLAQSTGATTTTEKTTTTTTTPTTSTSTELTPTTTTQTTPPTETPETPGPGGGTPAPGEETEEGNGRGNGNGNGHGGVGIGEGGGVGAGEGGK